MTDDKTPLLKPLADDIAELVKEEQSRPGPNDAAEKRILARVAGTLGLPIDGPEGPGGSGSGSSDGPGDLPEGSVTGSAGGVSTASSGGLGHILTGKGLTSLLVPAVITAVAVAVAVGVGSLVIYHSNDTNSEQLEKVSRPAAQESVLRDTPTPPAAASNAVTLAGDENGIVSDNEKGKIIKKELRKTPVSTPNRSSGSNAKAPVWDAVDQLSRERHLIEAARSALSNGNISAALGALQQHRKRFGKGLFVEERDALTIMALAKKGKRDQAAAQAGRFSRRYPNSLFSDAIRAALGSNEQ